MTDDLITGELPAHVRDELRAAKATLEHHGLADRLTELIGAPITASLKLLPSIAEEALQKAIHKSLQMALQVAVKSLGDESEPGKPSLLRHKLMAGISGAAGGAFGLTAVAIELPVSTVLILRSVLDIARSEGEDLTDVTAQLACLEVFAIDGGKRGDVDDDTEVGYFAVRAAMSKQVADASKYLLQHGAAETTAPPLVKLLQIIGNRFGVVVSEKMTAQAIPVIGAVGGALINSYFIDHYQDLARAHFTIRRLERIHGQAIIQEAYHRLDD